MNETNQMIPFPEYVKRIKYLAKKNGVKWVLEGLEVPEYLNFYGDRMTPNEVLNELLRE